MSNINEARLVAVKTLKTLFSNELTDPEILIEKEITDKRESDLSRRIVYGVLEKNEELEARISMVSKTEIKKIKPLMLANLKVALYQLLFLDKIPDFAAVNEAVLITKKLISPSLAGYTNAVLRNAIRKSEEYTSKTDAAKYNVPAWMISSFNKDYGSDVAQKILSGFAVKTNDIIRINTLKTTFEEVKELYKERVKASSFENSAEFVFEGNVAEEDGFKKGLFHFQNLSSQLCVKILSPRENQEVLDSCSSPGGKSFTMAEIMNNTGKIDCLDVSLPKIEKIVSGAKRLGITNLNPTVCDASKYQTEKKYDVILCDVPCSGLGLLRKKPFIKLKTEQSLKELPNLQFSILNNVSKYLKEGGTLVYSTCTLRKKENEEVLKRFLKQSDFEVVPTGIEIENSVNNENMLTVLPNGDYEGFFIAKLKRKEK